MTAITQTITDAGVSIWLDDLDRSRITSGNLQHLIDTLNVRGVTTNPSIFEKAIVSGSDAYAAQLATLKGKSVEEVVLALTTDDVRSACDIFAPLAKASDGVDGRVSIEVDPRLAHDTDATIEAARTLWRIVDRPNVLIKIPATKEGLPAIATALGEGISVNVTLIFSVDRYRDVLDAWMTGLERAHAAGHDISTIHSVASFFVSRVDVAVDPRLEAIGTEAATSLIGKSAVANACQAWSAFREAEGSQRVAQLRAKGAHIQRPLWASTGVKDPKFDPTMYVVDLVGSPCVNTMPEATLNAVRDQGEFKGDTLDGTLSAANGVWHALAGLGIDQADVCSQLETEGVAKFMEAWQELLDNVERSLADS